MAITELLLQDANRVLVRTLKAAEDTYPEPDWPQAELFATMAPVSAFRAYMTPSLSPQYTNPFSP